MSERSGRIAELDGWRGVSILCVVAGHVINVRYSARPGLEPANLFSVLSGWGVAIFFIVSGFLITRLAIAERTANGEFSIARFYARRILRIIPAFYVYLLCIALFAEWGMIEQPGYNTVLATTFVCNIPQMPCGWFAAHTWSLSYEEQFYLAFPLLLVFADRRFAAIFVALFVVLFNFPFVRFALHLEGGWRSASVFCSGFSLICVGAMAAAHEQRLRRLATGPYGTAISMISAGFVFVLGAFNSVIALPPGSAAAYLHAAISVLFPFCLAWVVLSVVYRGGVLGAFLRQPVLQFFGLISYSLYLWQEAFTAGANLYPITSPLMFPPLMLVAAVLSYYLVERPCIRAGRRLLTRGPMVPTALDTNEKAMAG